MFESDRNLAGLRALNDICKDGVAKVCATLIKQ